MTNPSSDTTGEMTKVLHKEIKENRILIVDDEPDVTLTLKVTLEDNGFKVDAFDDPLLALENFKVEVYDLAILDIKMPKMNGFELFREIKKTDNNVKVCFLTASEMFYEEHRQTHYSTIHERYPIIQKPIKNEELMKEINGILGHK